MIIIMMFITIPVLTKTVAEYVLISTYVGINQLGSVVTGRKYNVPFAIKKKKYRI